METKVVLTLPVTLKLDFDNTEFLTNLKAYQESLSQGLLSIPDDCPRCKVLFQQLAEFQKHFAVKLVLTGQAIRVELDSEK
ncbi:MAG: hypothetical protein QXX12_01815 [Nanopusillaceae archaeon]